MAELAPGPLDYVDARALRPLPARPSFEGILADGLMIVPGLDALFGVHLDAIRASATDDDNGFDALWTDTVGDGLNPPGDELAVDMLQVVDAGDNLDSVRQSVEHVLPPADASVELDYDEPPSPPNYDEHRNKKQDFDDRRDEVLD